MATTWIVAADSVRARILQVADRARLLEVEDLLNPDGRRHEGDLVSDSQESTAAVEHEVALFSKRIGKYLDKARAERRYDRLYLVAPPKFLGLLRKDLGREVEKLVSDDLDKDLSWFNAREIERYFAKGDGPAA
jgi:protein required for attachment to host cells